MGAMSQPPNIDLLGVIELKALVLELLAKVTEQERMIAAQRDEILRLKAGPAERQGEREAERHGQGNG